MNERVALERVSEEMLDAAVGAFWAADLYEHTGAETRQAMREAIEAALTKESMEGVRLWIAGPLVGSAVEDEVHGLVCWAAELWAPASQGPPDPGERLVVSAVDPTQPIYEIRCVHGRRDTCPECQGEIEVGRSRLAAAKAESWWLFHLRRFLRLS